MPARRLAGTGGRTGGGIALEDEAEIENHGTGVHGRVCAIGQRKLERRAKERLDGGSRIGVEEKREARLAALCEAHRERVIAQAHHQASAGRRYGSGDIG